MSKNPVVHFEMPYKDAKRVSEFYKSAFGWGMEPTNEEMGNYVIALTSDTDENGMVKTPGTINGGFYDETHVPKPEDKTVHVVINVDDIEQAKKDILAAGGTIKNDVMDIPGIGKYISILDTEGNAVGVLQPTRPYLK
ncbi:MAG TPA: VOC family protein [Patescibacteria group bacterium]|nr:VOC family protein [Patescibacteria group bacterium]